MIPWHTQDRRFEPGTVADIGGSIRLVLRQIEKRTPQEWTKNNEYRLYLSVRTHKEDGATDDLKRGVKVAVFKKCQSLQDAQDRADCLTERKDGWGGHGA